MAFPNLIFNQPVGLHSPKDGTNRHFVVEQPGTIRVFNNSATATSSNVFLDISSRIVYSGEQGLLGLAFHPNYTTNGYFYLDYVANNPLRTVISRFTVSPSDPNQAQSNSEFIQLQINQPYSNHKGGQLAFGPDGYLYIGMGDGGSEGDPLGNGQNRATLLGKILRIDVNQLSAGRNYTVPTDNPFKGNSIGYVEENYAYGFRNPWYFSFDQQTGKFWVGDLGQDRMEEIDLAQNSRNYGWNIMEGTLTYAGGNTTGLELPVWEYDHSQGNAIIGGYVYHGSALPQLWRLHLRGLRDGQNPGAHVEQHWRRGDEHASHRLGAYNLIVRRGRQRRDLHLRIRGQNLQIQPDGDSRVFTHFIFGCFASGNTAGDSFQEKSSSIFTHYHDVKLGSL
jgi:glucose/arabinose dehydrogenase